MMDRPENLARFEKVDKVHISDLNYLVYKSFHKELQTAINGFAKGKLLDIGCGNKPYQKWIEGNVSEYIGCDIVQSNLNKVDFVCPANKIPIVSNSFETILSTQAIEHIEDCQGMINEAHRLLKSGGYFILSGPFYWHLHEEPYDFYRFTKHGFKYLLEKQGFEIININENGGAWSTLGLMINHTFSFHNANANKIAKGVKYVFRKGKLHKLINRVFSYLDTNDFNTINTINYVVVAKKL